MKGFAYAAPRTLDEVIGLLAEHGDDAHLLAGGTAVVQMLKQGLLEPAVLVGLGAVDGLEGVAVVDGVVRIGPLTRLRRVEADQVIIANCPAVARTVAHVATARIRNQATLGGNLVHADPAQDPPPMLLAHDAAVELTGPEGVRRLPLTDFFVDVFETAITPDEVLTAIDVPIPAATSRFAYAKFLPRTIDDYATVSVAIRLDLRPDGTVADARIAFANAGPIPFRATDAEAALRDQIPTPALIAEVADVAAGAADPVDDARGSAAYKRSMARVWAARAIDQALLGGSAA